MSTDKDDQANSFEAQQRYFKEYIYLLCGCCNVQCPFLPCSHREDWGLEDPSGKSDDAFLETIHRIEEKILDLNARLSIYGSVPQRTQYDMCLSLTIL